MGNFNSGGGGVTTFEGRRGVVTGTEGDYNLAEMGDVTITSLATNDFLCWNGSAYVNCSPNFILRADNDGTVALVTGDREKLVTAGHASANAVSIAQAGTAGFESGWFTNFCTTGAGASTITPTTSTINGAATLVLNQWECATIISDGTNYIAKRNLSSGTSVGTLFAGNALGGSLAAGVTRYHSPNGYASTFQVTEANARAPLAAACTARNLYITTDGAQPGDATMVVTLMVNGSATSIVATIPAGGAANTYSNTSNTAAVTAGQPVSIRLVNNSSSTSATVRGFGFQCN